MQWQINGVKTKSAIMTSKQKYKVGQVAEYVLQVYKKHKYKNGLRLSGVGPKLKDKEIDNLLTCISAGLRYNEGHITREEYDGLLDNMVDTTKMPQL